MATALSIWGVYFATLIQGKSFSLTPLQSIDRSVQLLLVIVVVRVSNLFE
jgi:hypothetical protein